MGGITKYFNKFNIQWMAALFTIVGVTLSIYKECKDAVIEPSAGDSQIISSQESIRSINVRKEFLDSEGKIYFKENFFKTIKYYVDTRNRGNAVDNWDAISNEISCSDTLYLKETCKLYMKGYADNYNESLVDSVTFNFENFLAQIISTNNPLMDKMFVVDEESPMGGTYLLIDSVRKQAKEYRGEAMMNSIKNGYRIVFLSMYDEHKSITDPEYPRIDRIELQK